MAEIRRTTNENGGKPLGQSRFQTATDISPHHWKYYWPNWGAALQAAGYNPNTKWERVPDDELAKQLIPLIRKLGKYPTFGEMQVYRNQNPNFRFTVFTKRSKLSMVQAVLQYCEGKSQYKDIVKICKPLSSTSDKYANDLQTDNKRAFVYLIRGYPGQYKIGISDDPERRIYELTKGPYRPELVWKIETDDPLGIESYWHKRFEEKIMRGEWFKLSASDVRAFKRWKHIF